MTTGTEGNDDLTNNKDANPETIDALGGDDRITIQRPNFVFGGNPDAQITANGGSGFDTLFVTGTFRSWSYDPATGNGAFTIRASSSNNYFVTFTSIERFEISGTWFGTTGRVDTGEADDIVGFSPFTSGGQSMSVWTHGGNDRVSISGHFANAVAVTEAGDDIIDFSNVTGGSVGGYGGTGDDLYILGSTGTNVSVHEFLNEGIDEIRTSRFVFGLPGNVENLTGTSTTGQTLNGNELGNRITANQGADIVNGSFGDDVIVGGAGNDTLNGDADNDTITGDAGIDGINGGLGNDTVDYSREAGTLGVIVNLSAAPVPPFGHESLGRGVQTNEAIDTYGNSDSLNSIENARGSNQADYLYGSADANRLEGMGGNDRLEGGAGNDHLDGGTGADRMIGGTGDDTYVVDDAGDTAEENAGEGNDTVVSSAADYTLGANIENLTGASNDGQTLTGNDQNNTIVGGSGNDTIDGGGGADLMIGGAGNDVYVVDNEGDRVQENGGLSGGDDEVRTALASYSLAGQGSVERLAGTSSNGQTLTGNDEANIIDGGSGDDTLIGGEGDDTLRGNGGNDILIGLAGADLLQGGTGDDIYAIDAADTVDEKFAEGTDEVRTVATIFTLQQNIENLRGLNDGGHLFRGNMAPNGIIGANGNDLILAQDGGDDVLFGLGGDDQFYFGAAFSAFDFVRGGEGTDRLILQGNYSAGVQFGDGIAGNISEIERIELLSSSNTTYGAQSAGPNGYTLTMRDSNVQPGQTITIDASGLAANEFLSLNASAETSSSYIVLGGAGNDAIVGGSAGDRIVGGGGSDSINAGGGADVFVYTAVSDSTASAMDNLVTFTSGTDKIDVSLIDAIAGTPENDAFTFIGSGAFTAAGQLRTVDVGGGTWQVQGDVDGDGIADLVIQLNTGGAAPLVSDFVL